MKNFLILLFFIVLLAACKENYTPKPRGYFRIDFVPKTYHQTSNNYPFVFQIPDYATIKNDSKPQESKYWLNVDIPNHNAQVHISYYTISLNGKFRLGGLIEESRRLAYKHTIKADAIKEKLYQNDEKKVYGVVYQITGNAASPMQYFLTDSTKHFLRGALYIREVPNIDSVQPVIDFLEKDVVRMIETTNWN